MADIVKQGYAKVKSKHIGVSRISLCKLTVLYVDNTSCDTRLPDGENRRHSIRYASVHSSVFGALTLTFTLTLTLPKTSPGSI